MAVIHPHDMAPWAILLLALLIDALAGDPPWLYRRVPHPVVLVGRLVDFADRRLNREGGAPRERFLAGLFAVNAIVALVLALAWMVAFVLAQWPFGWLVEALLASSLIAFRGLYDHVRAVAEGLERGLAEGRAAVAHIVGRDPESLDEAGVARAAVESLAENFSDGVVAPVFWYLLLGLPGLCAYKAVNTLDSMIGHRSERYLYFGRAAARLDDAANWVPARLAAVLVVLAAGLLPGAAPGRALQGSLRDAPKHRSPNAGWPEAAFAGALGFALAGPRRYGAQGVDDHWMGDGRRDLGVADLHASLRLYLVCGAVLAALAVVGLLLSQSP